MISGLRRARAGLLLLLCLTASGTMPLRAEETASDPIMTLECRPPEPVAGEPISLVVRISNTSREAIPIQIERGSYLDYEVTASYVEIAAPVPETTFGRWSPFNRSSYGHELGPGETFSQEIPVSRLLDMTLPAEYRVRVVRRRVFVGEKLVSLSAEIVIDVKSPPPATWRVTSETPPPQMAPLPPPPSVEEVEKERMNWLLSGWPLPVGAEPAFGRAPAPRWPLALGAGLGGLVIGFALAALIFRRRVMQAALLASEEEGT